MPEGKPPDKDDADVGTADGEVEGTSRTLRKQRCRDPGGNTGGYAWLDGNIPASQRRSHRAVGKPTGRSHDRGPFVEEPCEATSLMHGSEGGVGQATGLP